MRDPRRSPEKVLVEDLTWREQEVLTLLVQRLTNREIGDRLHLTENTVKSHVGNIISKLGVKNRRQAVERARELDLLPSDKNAAPGFTQALPAETTTFIGQAEELAEIRRLLDGTRLLTLTGTGGIGKTRLALKAASELRDQYADGVFLVRLSPLRSGKDILQATANAVGLPLATEEAPLAQLLSHLRRRQLLLVMDNFEHLLGEVNIVARILQEAPKVKVLATSRERLKLQGETALEVTGLDYPGPEASTNARNYDAVKLLLDRIHRVDPKFNPDAEDLKHLMRICRLVQGMPLAIELAAGWINVLSPQELAGEIQQSLDILTSENRDLPERHRSMRAVFDHAWSFLDQAERQAFMYLSVFRGGFSREAGQTVAKASLQSLAGLVNKSFLRHDPASGRFESHELLRDYAQEKLAATPGANGMAQEAHAAYFADFMQGCWGSLRDRRQKAALAEIEADLENIRSAWRYWLGKTNAQQMEKFVNSFWLAYWFRGWNHGAEELFREAVEALSLAQADQESAAVRALALGHQAYFKTWLGSAEQGYGLAKESVSLLEPLNRPFEFALALGSLNLAADFLTLYDEAEQAARRMLEIAKTQADDWLLAFALYKVSVANPPKRDHAETKRVAQASMNLFEDRGERMASMLTLVTLGHAARALGEDAQAREIYLRCLRTSEDVGYRWGTANACKYLGQIALSQNRTAEAETYLFRSLGIAEESGVVRDQVNLLCDVARLRLAQGNAEQAVELLAMAIQHPASQLHRLGGGRIRDRVQDLLITLEAALTPDAYAAAWKRGDAREFDQGVAELLSAAREVGSQENRYIATHRGG